MAIHRVAATGYDACGDLYDRARPGYPEAALDVATRELRIGADAVVLELGAGTGKLTRGLCRRAREVIALEPVEDMRRRLAGAVPQALALGGAAERIPLAAGCVDAVVVGTAFHWFDGDKALAEIDRVLRPGGGLALLWNNPDRDHDWVAEVWRIVDRHRGPIPGNRDLRWRQAFEGSERFTPLRSLRFAHRERTDLQGLVERVASISFIAALPEPARSEVLTEVTRVARSHPSLAGRQTFVLPYRTDLDWCWRAG